MDIRTLNDDIAVGPQITLDMIEVLREQGYQTIINNRPDEEIAMTGGPTSGEVQAAAEAAGLAYHYLPIPGSGFGPEHVKAMSGLMENAGKTFAYCRSGTRSCNVWALTQAGLRAPDDIIADGAKGGYDLRSLAGLLATPIA
jgi:uncharacterized protein (TIGR01244 family)